MKYKKIIAKPQKKIRLNSFLRGIDNEHDDMVASLNSAKEFYNFDISTGSLTPLKGFVEQELKPFGGFWTVAQNSGHTEDGKKYYSAVFVDDTGLLMGYDFDEHGNAGIMYEAPDQSYRFTSVPQITEYKKDGKDAVLLTSPTDGMVVWLEDGYQPRKIENAPLITSMAKHGERLFVTVADRADRVWYSDEVDPTNWNVSLDGAGYIGFKDERGECEKVLTLGGYVYVFREHGISRITAYGEQTEFVVEHVFSSGSRICASSVTLCGNRIIFACDDGIFSFNGSSVVRLLPLLSPALVFNENTVTAYYKGKLYLATKMYTEKAIGCESAEHVNNVMIVYDTYTDKYGIYRGIDVRRITPMYGVDKVFMIVGNQRKVCVMTNGNDYNGELIERKWRSPESDFGVSEKKLLKSISLFTDYDIVLKVYSESGTVERKIRGKLSRSTVPINLSSHTFAIEFISTDYNCRIASPTLIYY